MLLASPLERTVMGACAPSGGDSGLTLAASASLLAADVVLPPLSPFRMATPPPGAARFIIIIIGGRPCVPAVSAQPSPAPPTMEEAAEPDREEARLSAAPPGFTDGERSESRPCTMSGSSSRRPSSPWPPPPSAPDLDPLKPPPPPIPPALAAAAAAGGGGASSSSILWSWDVRFAGRSALMRGGRIQCHRTTPAPTPRGGHNA